MCRLTLLLLLLFTAADACGLTVTFVSKAQVENSVITLGDIATFDEETAFSKALADQPVGQAPAPGQELDLAAQSVVNRLATTIDPTFSVRWQGSAQVKVTRTATVIGSEEILRIIDTFIRDNTTEMKGAKVRFLPSAKPLPFALPSGKLSYEVIPSDPEIIGSSRFSIIFKVDDRVRRNMSVRGRMEVMYSVVVLTKNVAKGAILTPTDIKMVVMDISRLREPVLDPREVLGKRLLVSLRSGRPLRKHQVEFPPLVKKGQLVRMIIKRGALIISATGIARSDGVANETIRVKNSRSKKIVYCRVTAPGIVEVIL